MYVSWNWLKDYLELKMDPAELAERLAMAGLNHEDTQTVGDDLRINLEITSNRADCLGHLGVAREIATLYQLDWRKPSVELPRGNAQQSAAQQIQVAIEAADICPRYIARVIRGVRVGSSPAWLANRLRTIDLAVINNVVDISNYVMMECGQPLHIFDLHAIRGRRIVVRRAAQGELFTAIDHKQYELDPQTCVIADAERAVALAGVMGGVDSEVSPKTVDILVEAADFHPLAVRGASRKFKLPSPSAYRFERRVDPEGIDWASRRACQLILELAGGELCEGVVDCHPGASGANAARTPVELRWSQLPRVLGIDPPRATVLDILQRLGVEKVRAEQDRGWFAAPSWRRDLSREIDLIEEVARIHGYDKIPEDVSVPMAASQRTQFDRVLQKVRQVLLAAGVDEALTPSVVDEKTSELFSPWTSQPALVAQTPMLRGADRLRRSLIPSLLQARQINQAASNSWVELFETARIYLPVPGELPCEPWMLGLTSGRDFLAVKGIIESILIAVGIDAPLMVEPCSDPLLDAQQAVRLVVKQQCFGVLGALSASARKQLGLRSDAVIAELHLDLLTELAQLIPQARTLSSLPCVEIDLNMIVDESVKWSDLAATVQSSAGPFLEGLEYRETYRDAERDGAGKKRLLFTLSVRGSERTLTGEELEAIRLRVTAACQTRHQAQLLGA